MMQFGTPDGASFDAASALQRMFPRTAAAVEADEPQPGPIFRDLRRYLGVTPSELARRLGTHVDVINALESGDAKRLPSWPETVRVVTELTRPLGIDAGPVLQLIGRQWQRRNPDQPERASRAIVTYTASTDDDRRSHFSDAAAQVTALAKVAVSAGFGAARNFQWRRISGRRLVVLIAAGATVASFGLATGLSALPVTGLSLTGPLRQMARSVEDFVLYHTSPQREGLRWIEVDDPRSRRSDKLQTR